MDAADAPPALHLDGGRSAGSPGSLSIEELQIIGEIQELQRQLREIKTTQAEEHDDDKSAATKEAPRRVLVVANRLPIKATRDSRNARWTFEDAPGGLATALRGISMDVEFIWIGWVGCDVAPAERARVAERLMREHACYPVFLDPVLVDKYYNGFCNDVLWPLFHYVPLPMYQAGAEKKFDASLWEAYREANARFADAVMEVYSEGDDKETPDKGKESAPPKKGLSGAADKKDKKADGAPTAADADKPKKRKDLVWVHDYHLMRLPYELRRRSAKIPVAWFLHTPFPSSEIYRILPFRKELLEGLLHADLVGFHTYDYARHFLSACSRVLDVSTTTPKGIEFEGRFCSIGVFPIGIEPKLIRTALASRAVNKRLRELAETFRGRKIIIGVDRLDYIKGMPHKLLAFELFLAKYPQWVGKVTLIQVGVPTRVDVAEYQALAKHVNELVGRINGIYGTLEYSPIHYINQSIPQDELIAIYHLADACLVTSVRDGMNLVSHEYVAAQEVLASSKQRVARQASQRHEAKNSPTAGPTAAGKAASPKKGDDSDSESDDEDDEDEAPAAADKKARTVVDGGAGYASGYAYDEGEGYYEGTAATAARPRPRARSGATANAPGGSAASPTVASVAANVVDNTATTKARRASFSDDSGVSNRSQRSAPSLPAFVKDGPGALVLSEFAGSAQSLSGALRVNPWNTEELARSIHQALTLSRVERELRWSKLQRYVDTNTATHWARSFMGDFRDVFDHPPLLSKLPKLKAAEVLRAYEKAKTRLIVADYDGTLTQIQSLPQLATPAPVVTQLLATLARDDRNTVYVMSGRERRFMDKWLGKLRVGLAAEFGFCHRGPDDAPGVWTSLGRELDTSWKDVVRPIMQYFAERTPGSYIENKESSLAWHYRDADPHFGAWQAKDMQIHMEDVLANLPLEIIQGNRLVEVRHHGVNKSVVLEEVLKTGPRRPPVEEEATSPVDGGASPPPLRFAQMPASGPPVAAGSETFEFIMVVGDDRSDEDMYQLLKTYHARLVDGAGEGGKVPAVYLVHIGTGATGALPPALLQRRPLMHSP
ncbi:glycosyltransferase family 20-domain-containing protein [Pelagophyceae sp. CCMP2097]|nr:glycosyltransferase family 20-domain-containing protein [Pelagophyceae sp. CCMP2097]